jgi:hypothetical protein
MTVKIKERSSNSITLEVKIHFSNSMLDSEEEIQRILNETGTMATGELLRSFDADGSPIQIGSERLTAKKQLEKKVYETPYGSVPIERYVYQTSKGGGIFCPLDKNARIIVSSTPKFAKQVSHKTAEMASTQVHKDLESNHGRKISRSFLHRLAESVGSIAQMKEEDWEYVIPDTEKLTEIVTVGLDGTCMLLCEDGYREAMVGTITLYDKDGERQNTIYSAAAPEYGKQKFKNHLSKQIETVRARSPEAKFIGLADGAKDNWIFLEERTDEQTLDFWHCSEYVSSASEIIHPQSKEKRFAWLEIKLHELKHDEAGLDNIVKEVKLAKKEKKLTKIQEERLDAILTYFKNNKDRINYSKRVKNNEPIGSGVTEAACKVIVKQRMCKSGAKWKTKGAGVVLTLRTLSRSINFWDQFWSKINQFGTPVI